MNKLYEYKNYGGGIQDAYSFTVYEDNTEYARATKVVSLGNNQYDYARSGLNDVPNDPKDRETLPPGELIYIKMSLSGFLPSKKIS